jgi:hypothetical protein
MAGRSQPAATQKRGGPRTQQQKERSRGRLPRGRALRPGSTRKACVRPGRRRALQSVAMRSTQGLARGACPWANSEASRDGLPTKSGRAGALRKAADRRSVPGHGRLVAVALRASHGHDRHGSVVGSNHGQRVPGMRLTVLAIQCLAAGRGLSARRRLSPSIRRNDAVLPLSRGRGRVTSRTGVPRPASTRGSREG